VRIKYTDHNGQEQVVDAVAVQEQIVGRGTVTDRDAIDTSKIPLLAKFIYSDSAGSIDTWYGPTAGWIRTHTGGAASAYEQGLLAGERNVDSASDSYQVTRHECNLTMVDVQTAITIGGGAAGDTHLMGILITVALTGTCVITGFAGSAETPISITLPAGTAAGLIDFKGAVNSEGPLTVTCSNAADDNDVAIMWKPV
jgi:hypothetical protein